MESNINNKLNFVFWGTPDVACQTLEILKQNGFIPSLIITAPDKPQGRKMLITPPPVKVWAEQNNVPFIQPDKLEELNIIFAASAQADEPSKAILQQENMSESKKDIKFDLSIVVAYGKIIPKYLIDAPKLGSINIHYSLLPKYRGASPVESAILNGDNQTGVSIQKMEYKMDSGPLIAVEKIPIIPDEKAPDLRKRLIKIGGELLVKTLNTPSASDTSPYIREGWVGVLQDESEATYCKKIKKEDGLISEEDLRESVLDQSKSVILYNKFRAYFTWPRIFFFQNNKRIIISHAMLENSEFKIKKVLPESRKEIAWEEFQRQS